MAGAGQPNMDQFEAYFRRADVDGDGRISGTEAVNFFQGANLPQQVLAQIWTLADQSCSGFLGRQEFYNYLKLVTVAQSKRDLTPEIVKAALYGPASAKIPPPKINVPAAPMQQVNPMTAASSPQMGTFAPTAVQNPGFRGPGLPNPTMSQQYFPSQQSQTMRPPQAIPQTMRPPQAMPPGIASGPPHGIPSQVMPTATTSRLPQPMPGSTASPGIPTSSISTDWLGGKSSSALSVPPSTPNVTIQSQTQFSILSQPSANDSKALPVSGNGLPSGSSFGGDVFSATLSTKKQEPSLPYSSSGSPALATAVPATSGGLSVKSNSLESLQSAYAMQPLGGQLQRTQSLPTSGQQVSASVSSSITSPSISAGVENSSDNSQPSWPKMKPADVQKYTKVFVEVDTDRDGKITGEQARNLFLSWRLPREVLKQVWDLSDQDSDSMLSLREFCFALYLMERYREGRSLPASLPSNVMFDEALLSMTGQPKATYGNAAWGPNPGFGQQPGMVARPMAPTTVLRPPAQASAVQSQPDSILAPNQQKPRAPPVLEDNFLNQNDSGEHSSMPQDGTASEKKVGEPEKIILDSKEKIEFYRSKMQDLVLYKSRCDNRLNEITERALADKREAEILGKKYEEKYKQVAEVASKLTIEEATFRDIQERKFELNQAIVNMEHGGSADGILQVRADRIQSDLDELMRVLIERCKKHGLEIKTNAMIELPFGWQPGIQEGAAVWDEDWDKFEDEGFSNDLTIDVKNDSASNSKSTVHKETGSPDGTLTPDSLSNGGGKSPNFFDGESAYAHSEDELARSPQSSSAGRTALESPSQDFSDVFAKSIDADAETHKSFDESTWGAFDTHDDTDSVWGFNPASTKDSESDKHRDLFETDDFGIKPIKTGSASSESFFQRKSPFFEDSVAGSPVSRFGNSPRYSDAGDHIDNFSRLDSLNTHEGFSPQGKLTRFDSLSSTKDFGHSRAFSSFDDADPFGSSGPFKVSSDNQTSKRGSENWSGF